VSGASRERDGTFSPCFGYSLHSESRSIGTFQTVSRRRILGSPFAGSCIEPVCCLHDILSRASCTEPSSTTCTGVEYTCRSMNKVSSGAQYLLMQQTPIWLLRARLQALTQFKLRLAGLVVDDNQRDGCLIGAVEFVTPRPTIPHPLSMRIAPTIRLAHSPLRDVLHPENRI
jgi:hypothetical protein